jgi:hypothetical protein
MTRHSRIAVPVPAASAAAASVATIVAVVAVVAPALAGAAAPRPAVTAHVRLSALPATLANGPAGPLNRVAFDLESFDPRDPHAVVTCLYPDAVEYACATQPDASGDGERTHRIVVTIPDLGRGPRAIVRFRTAHGRVDEPVEIVNAPRIVHEIEAVTLADGGATTTRGDGVEVPVRQLATLRATTVPALATAPALVVDCERIVAEWVGASATDPVFTSRFGALNGSLVPARAVPRAAPVAQDTLPEWLITYPLGATRVQFIAHYEVIYRAVPCERRVLGR